VDDVLKRIYEYSLEEIMGERFGSYSKYIIQDRAIPDVRDGLKPVQRRILYSMYKKRNTYDKPYLKSASTVGDVIGNYHPHGDSSIYDAMVRMSQAWKVKNPYIDMHGNNGSIDGDPPAAYRYTEARLSKISNELLKDLEKDTVSFAPNFDDRLLEPTVLPAKFPNLLVNGSNGISAGYATNIPPHNLGEVIDAVIKRIDSPNCKLDTILEIVKGPDFPTGGIAYGIDGIRNAYETGRGKILVKSKISFDKNKNREQIVVTEIPYEVNKASLVRKIDEIRVDKKIDGIIEVRDESDREGLRIVIDIKKESDREIILNYLLKNTELQITYNFNMVAIVNRRPKQLGILPILDAYIEHQKEVVTKRTQFDLAHAEARYHIVEGLIKALSILDEVIRVIRASKNKSDAKDNLVKEFAFTELQAEAIVMLQLYKLTNTDVTLLEEELASLKALIEELKTVLEQEDVLKSIIKKELREIKKEYSLPRMTVIFDEVPEIKLDTIQMIPKEDVLVVVTHDGYVKRVSMRSYSAANDNTGLKQEDYVLSMYEMSTLDTLLLFTNNGDYLYVPVHELPDCKWKDLGKHISNIIPLKPSSKIIAGIPVYDFAKEQFITTFTKQGMVKRTKINDYQVQRYSKPLTAMKLKEGDEVIDVTASMEEQVFLATKKGYGLWFAVEEIPVVGVKAAGVKSIHLKEDEVAQGIIFSSEQEYITILTNKGNGKRIRFQELEKSSRAKRGLVIQKEVKSNPQEILKAFIVDCKRTCFLISAKEVLELKLTEIPIMDRYSSGSSLCKGTLYDVYLQVVPEKKEDILKIKKTETKEIKKEPAKKEVSLQEIDDRLMTIDDFLDILED